MVGIVCLLMLAIYISDTALGRAFTVLLCVWLFWFWLVWRIIRTFFRPKRVHHGR